MPQGWKFTRSNGTDWHTGEVNYRDHIGREMVHPNPDTKSGKACSEGYHLGKTLKDAGEYCKPGAVFRCSYSRKDVLGEDDDKVRVSKLKVIEEAPAWKGYGPRGKQVQEFIDSLKGIPWFENVGEPYEEPKWAEKIVQVEGWREAVAKAGAEAVAVAEAGAEAVAVTGAYWDALYACYEIIDGIEDGYFSRLMEVYRAGHSHAHSMAKRWWCTE